MVRWSFLLIEYNVKIEHSVGKENALAEALSLNTQERTKVVEDIKLCVLPYWC